MKTLAGQRWRGTSTDQDQQSTSLQYHLRNTAAEVRETFCRRNRRLLHQQKTPQLTVSLSPRSLSDSETALLRRGLNFAVTPKNILLQRLLPRLNQRSDHSIPNKQTLSGNRFAVNGILQQAKPQESNTTKEMQNALKTLNKIS